MQKHALIPIDWIYLLLKKKKKVKIWQTCFVYFDKTQKRQTLVENDESLVVSRID